MLREVILLLLSMSPIMVSACSEYSTCERCNAEYNCEWCYTGTTNACQHTWNTCAGTSFLISCPVDSCASITDPATCQSHATCSWCFSPAAPAWIGSTHAACVNNTLAPCPNSAPRQWNGRTYEVNYGVGSTAWEYVSLLVTLVICGTALFVFAVKWLLGEKADTPDRKMFSSAYDFRHLDAFLTLFINAWQVLLITMSLKMLFSHATPRIPACGVFQYPQVIDFQVLFDRDWLAAGVALYAVLLMSSPYILLWDANRTMPRIVRFILGRFSAMAMLPIVAPLTTMPISEPCFNTPGLTQMLLLYSIGRFGLIIMAASLGAFFVFGLCGACREKLEGGCCTMLFYFTTFVILLTFIGMIGLGLYSFVQPRLDMPASDALRAFFLQASVPTGLALVSLLRDIFIAFVA